MGVGETTILQGERVGPPAESTIMGDEGGPVQTFLRFDIVACSEEARKIILIEPTGLLGKTGVC